MYLFDILYLRFCFYFSSLVLSFSFFICFFFFLIIRPPPGSTRTDTLFPSPPLFRPREVIPEGIPALETVEALAELKARFLSYGGDRPAIALAVKWCEDHLPAPAEPVLVHGDYRMGNVMVDAGGLAAVPDWELAHLGDAHEEIGRAHV